MSSTSLGMTSRSLRKKRFEEEKKGRWAGKGPGRYVYLQLFLEDGAAAAVTVIFPARPGARLLMTQLGRQIAVLLVPGAWCGGEWNQCQIQDQQENVKLVARTGRT